MKNMKNMKRMFALSLIFCVVIVGFMPSGIEKVGIMGTATADYVDASNNTNCIEPDPLVPGWSKDVRLTNDSAESMHPTIAIDSKNNIHVLWEDTRSGSREIYYKSSKDGGKTWSEDRYITNIEGSDSTPSMVSDQNDVIHIAWVHGGSSSAEIYYMNSTNYGETWGPYIRLTNAYGESFAPKLATYENMLYLVWSDKRDGNFEIYYKKSDNGGNNWDGDIRLTYTNNTSKNPSLDTDSEGNIHIVWQEWLNRTGNKDYYTTYYKKGTNNGIEWYNITRISDGFTDYFGNCEISIDKEDIIHVIFVDHRSQGEEGDIFYVESVDHGVTWGKNINITEQSYADSWMVSATTDMNNNFYAIWVTSNRTDNSNDLYFSKKIVRETFDKVERITNAMYGTRMCPKIAIDNNNILHHVWFDRRNDHISNKEIYYKRTLNPVTEPPITVIQSLNQTTCKPGDSILVSGNAVYNDSIVPNADVSIKILETGDEWTTMTDPNGDYSKTITAPDTPGNYTVRVTITSGNHTGWKQMRLTVEQESTNGGTTNGDTTNGGQQPDGENEQGINFNYVVMIVGVIAVCIIVGVILVKCRGKPATKTREKKTEKTTMGLRCPKCKKIFRVELKPKPFNVKCPNCGKEGVIK